MGVRTRMGFKNESTDYNNKKLKPVFLSKKNRLSKVHNHLITNFERNLREANNYFTKFHYEPKHVKETARKIYNKIVEKKITAGRSIKNALTSSFYLARVVQKIPTFLTFFLENLHFLDDVDIEKCEKKNEVIMNRKKEINRFNNEVRKRKVLKELGYFYSPKIPLVEIFERLNIKSTNEDNTPTELFGKVRNNIIECFKYNKFKSGKEWRTVTGTICYLTLKSSKYEKSQAEVARKFLMTAGTIRNITRDLKKFSNLADLLNI